MIRTTYKVREFIRFDPICDVLDFLGSVHQTGKNSVYRDEWWKVFQIDFFFARTIVRLYRTTVTLIVTARKILAPESPFSKII